MCIFMGYVILYLVNVYEIYLICFQYGFLVLDIYGNCFMNFIDENCH